MFLAELSSLVGRAPSHILRVHSENRLAILSTLHVLLHQLRSHTDHMLTLPVLDHVQGLKGTNDILLSEAGHITEHRNTQKNVLILIYSTMKTNY